MRKKLSMLLTLLSSAAFCTHSITVQDNHNIALTLSQANYNRLVVKNDKIMEAVFPPNAMAIKRDDLDGSVYVMLSSTTPFTLFLTTEAGRHFSVTLSGEEALGKTIELVPEKPVIATHTPNPTKTITTKAVPEAILAMLTHMEQRKPFADVSVKRQFGKAERWPKGLTLLPREYWDGKLMQGEIIELYNGGKTALDLSQDWFAKQGTLAVKLAKASLGPGERTMLYRVQEVSHG